MNTHIKLAGPWLKVLAGCLALLLPVFAILQYRWIGEVSAAERQRLDTSLRVGASRFSDDFDAELTRLFDAFILRNGFPGTATPLVGRYNAWAQTAAFPHIVKGIYTLKVFPDKTPEYYSIDMHSGQMGPAAVPPELEDVRNSPPTPLGSPSRFPSIEGKFIMGIPIRQRQVLLDRVLLPFNDASPPATAPPDVPEPPIEGWIVLELNRDAFAKDVIPSLVNKHFLDADKTAYRVGLVTRDDPPRLLYSSPGTWEPEDMARADASINIFGGNLKTTHVVSGDALTGRAKKGVHGEEWALLVTHRLGSLEVAVQQVRQRNLAVSFGILAVLGAGIFLIAFYSQRARSLAKLQMEFAAGISHEIRTPLSVIRSAAHNMRTGVVSSREGIERYSSIVEDEARRLSSTLDQLMLYSETNSKRKKYKLMRIDVNEIIENAAQGLPPDDIEKCQLTMNIEDDLPQVMSDANALSQCVQNLLSNACKYGHNGGPPHIEVKAVKDERLGEVQLSIADDGPGINAHDRRQLFRPFYRGGRTGSNIPGNGLGLYLVRRIMAALGGRVTVDSPPRGARFTLHIPVAK